MDSAATMILFGLIEENKDVLLSKSHLKDDLQLKQEAWASLTLQFCTITSMVQITAQLQKRWQNVFSLMKKKHDWNTGTGEHRPLSTIEQAAQRIVGVDNPIINRVPGALFTTNSTAFIRPATTPPTTLPTISPIPSNEWCEEGAV